MKKDDLVAAVRAHVMSGFAPAAAVFAESVKKVLQTLKATAHGGEPRGQSRLSAVCIPVCACLPSRSKAGLSSGARRRDGPWKVNSAV